MSRNYTKYSDRRNIENTARYRHNIDNILNGAKKNLDRVCNYTKSGKHNNAPFFSKRGHIAESTAAFSLLSNCCTNMVDLSQVGVATDEMSFNIDKLKKNDQYRDIIVTNLSKNITNSYQSKVCATREASIKAATNKKYKDKGVSPYVPKDHSDKYGNIGINVDGKNIKSDSYTLNDLNRITEAYSKGEFINPFKDDKTAALYNRAITKGVGDAAKSAFMCSGIKEIVDYVTGKEINDENSVQTLANMCSCVIDGSTRSFIKQDAGFKSYGKKSAIAMAEASYDTAVELISYAAGRKTGSEMLYSSMGKVGEIAGDYASSKLMEKVGISLGSPFGAVGSIIGGKIGQSCGKYLSTLINSNKTCSMDSIGRSIGRQNQYASSFGGMVEPLTDISNELIGSMMPLVQGAQLAFDVVDSALNLVNDFIDEFQTSIELSKVRTKEEHVKKEINKAYNEAMEDYAFYNSDVLSSCLNGAINSAYMRNIMNMQKALDKPINQLIDIQNEFNELNVSDDNRLQFANECLEFVNKSDNASFSVLKPLIEDYAQNEYFKLDSFVSINSLIKLMER